MSNFFLDKNNVLSDSIKLLDEKDFFFVSLFPFFSTLWRYSVQYPSQFFWLSHVRGMACHSMIEIATKFPDMGRESLLDFSPLW